MPLQLDLFDPNRWIYIPKQPASKSQSVSNGDVSHVSETEQQRQRQFRACKEQEQQFRKSCEENPCPGYCMCHPAPVKKKTNRSTQKSKLNYYGTQKKIEKEQAQSLLFEQLHSKPRGN